MKKLFILTAALVVLMSMVAINASAIPVTLQSVKIDGTELDATGFTTLDLERGQTFDLNVNAMATQSISNVEIQAFISGYEYNDVNPISASTSTFDMAAYTNYVKKMQLTLPSNVQQDNYQLRIIVSDRNGDTSIFQYNILISRPRHDIEIKDVILNPSDSVQAGHALLASVRVRNYGQMDESSLKATVSIPGLGVSAVHYLDQLDSENATTSEELFLRIPNCAVPGLYTVKTTVSYDEGYSLVSKDSTILVAAGDLCTQSGTGQNNNGQSIITFGSELQDISVGQGGAIYPVTIQNTGSTQKTYIVSVEGADFADYKISPSNVMILPGGQTQTAYIYMTAKPTATAGLQTFVVTVNADADSKQAVLKANVKTGNVTKPASSINVQNAVLAVFIVLVVILIILGLILAFSRKSDSDNESKGKYY